MTKASQEDRDRIISALEAGRLVYSDMAKRALVSTDLTSISADRFDITEIKINFWGPTRIERGGKILSNQGGMEIMYNMKSAGFGSATFCLRDDGRLTIDNEGMSKEFIAKLMMFLLDKLEFPK